MTRCAQLAAVVLTYNESPNIRACLESVKGLCEIFVVDSGSQDDTTDICREYTTHIFQNPYENHARQWQWALANLPLHAEWVLALDADFVVTPELASRLECELAQVAPDIAAVYVRHLYVFGGNLIRFGGTKQYWMRLIRRGRAQPDLSDLVDFRFVADGPVAQWPEPVVEYNRHDDDISVWLRKQDKFSLRLAVEEELRRAGQHHWQIKPSFTGHADQRFAWLRDRWQTIPLFWRPALYFIYRYILAGGFLDGRGGFLYHSLQGFWFRVMVDWKIDQLRKHRFTNNDRVRLSTLMLKTKSGSVDELIHELHTTSASND
jgi:glycosyltransferase involved in cell wall biosynthesis